MTNMIRSIRSTLNFFLAMLELFVSTLLAIKIFSLDIGSENGLVGYIIDFLETIDNGVTWATGGVEVMNSISFLIIVLVFMIFGQSLFMSIPGIIERERQNNAKVYRRQYLNSKKRRFNKNRFLKNKYRYY